MSRTWEDEVDETIAAHTGRRGDFDPEGVDELGRPNEKEEPMKMYLGDSVYAETSKSEVGGIYLTTENGIPTDPSNQIYLEPAVLEALGSFREAVRAAQIQRASALVNQKGKETEG